MTWEDLNKDNIEWIKQLYEFYLDEHKDKEYTSNLKTLEEFMEEELVKCEKCGEWTTREYTTDINGIFSYLCPECYDKTNYTDEIDPYDEWRE